MTHMDIGLAAAMFRCSVYGLATLLVLRFMFWPTMVEEFRQRMFALRRELFVLMVDNHLPPEDPAYVQIRSMLNGLIRYAERMSFTRLVIAAGPLRQEAIAYEKHLKQNMVVHSPEVIAAMMNVRQRASIELFGHVGRTSPMAWIAVVIIVVSRLFSKTSEKVQRMKDTVIGVAEAEATCKTEANIFGAA